MAAAPFLAQLSTILCVGNEETRIGRDGEKSAVKFKDLKVGQTVRTYYTTSDKIAEAVIIAKPGSK